MILKMIKGKSGRWDAYIDIHGIKMLLLGELDTSVVYEILDKYNYPSQPIDSVTEISIEYRGVRILEEVKFTQESPIE